MPQEDPIQTLEVDNETVQKLQLERLINLKSNRDSEKVAKTLEKILNCAKTGEGNLLDLSIIAAKNRATLGEISNAMEQIFGRYEATIKAISGVYSKEIS